MRSGWTLQKRPGHDDGHGLLIGRAGVFGAAVLVVLSALFVMRNGGRRVSLDLVLFRLDAVPLSVVVFGAILTGMAVMLLAGLRSDLRVREILRKKWEEEGRREQEWRDRTQQDLFGSEDDEARS